MFKKFRIYIITASVFLIILLLGITIFNSKRYSWITLSASIIPCIFFFMSFEDKKTKTEKMMVIAVMTAVSVIGRIIFSPLPGFKPVTAVVVITAVYFGSEAGFLTGALSAVISNFFFGHGPWTPLQMLTWGLIGLFAGLLSMPLKRSKLLLTVYGIISGIAFSMVMDIWTVIWWDNKFTVSRYIAALVSSLGFTAVYAISNVVFLLSLNAVTGKKLDRLKSKYGL